MNMPLSTNNDKGFKREHMVPKVSIFLAQIFFLWQALKKQFKSEGNLKLLKELILKKKFLNLARKFSKVFCHKSPPFKYEIPSLLLKLTYPLIFQPGALEKRSKPIAGSLAFLKKALAKQLKIDPTILTRRERGKSQHSIIPCLLG